MIKRSAWTALVVWLLILLCPMMYIGLLSVRQRGTYEMYFSLIPKHLTLDNYRLAMNAQDIIGTDFITLYRNSLIVTGSALLLALAAGSLMAYALAGMEFRGKELIANVLLIGLMIPVQILLIPLFLEIKRFGLHNTYFSLIFPYAALGVPFVIFVMRGFFESLPKDLFEQAEIDGCSKFGQFWRIALPLARSGILPCAIFLFLQYWNEFLFALVFIQKDSLQTLPLGVFKFESMGMYTFPVELDACAVMIGSLPVLVAFMVFNRQFIVGLTAGAVKE